MTNQFTDEQVEAAYRVNAEVHFDLSLAAADTGEAGGGRARGLQAMRAALEATAGAAPQAGSGERLEDAINAYIREVSDVPFRLSVIENWNEHVRGIRAALATPVQPSSAPGQLTRKFDSGRWAMLNEAGVIVGYYTPPVRPSSAVDEGKLSEVLEVHRYQGMGDCACGEVVQDDHREHVARAVAEWLRGQSR
ncbi:hypothetical protein [Leucobacter sp. cx-169]|uniref:hypothetical protein n=1 Tax=Leucobacter sp. cx-169 TaxID=2770549 RepID=UPI00165E8F14|nr:hypothetical protein [Leucobacter sp. cx-169]MBC9927203.1 hypothetical protein [Leucobacter sp. cx-169]